jgi:hypothetical protein
VSGFEVFVMVTEFTKPKQAKNIGVNGKMMTIMAKANGPKIIVELFLETSEMICELDYAL